MGFLGADSAVLFLVVASLAQSSEQPVHDTGGEGHGYDAGAV